MSACSFLFLFLEVGKKENLFCNVYKKNAVTSKTYPLIMPDLFKQLLNNESRVFKISLDGKFN